MSYKQQRKNILDLINSLNSTYFNSVALQVFQFQAEFNPVYNSYLKLLKLDPQKIQNLSQVPFLPISLFKNHIIKTGQWDSVATFSSSGTTGLQSSKHEVKNIQFYLDNTLKGFSEIYPNPNELAILALLPSYLEREGSSLVAMANYFIQNSKYEESGFFLNEFDELAATLIHLRKLKIPTLLIGVSFALLDFAETHAMDLSGVIMMETGGMKGKRKELTRRELHNRLKGAFQLDSIHSEYGMTELFSQAYMKDSGYFKSISTMKVLTRDLYDPLATRSDGKTGALNIIDLANFDTCSFVATDDLGRVQNDGSFEILGRIDNSDIRGCNLMVE